MSYVISGLDPKQFAHLFGESNEALAAQHIARMTVDGPAFPDRITLVDLPLGKSVLLLNYEHQPAATPYQSAHAIFVVEDREAKRAEHIDDIPAVMKKRPISLRAFDSDGNMLDAVLSEGTNLEPHIARMFEDPKVAYLHAHYAIRGCYAARIDRYDTSSATVF